MEELQILVVTRSRACMSMRMNDTDRVEDNVIVREARISEVSSP